VSDSLAEAADEGLTDETFAALPDFPTFSTAAPVASEAAARPGGSWA
jgi:hypothetical protein